MVLMDSDPKSFELQFPLCLLLQDYELSCLQTALAKERLKRFLAESLQATNGINIPAPNGV